MLRCRPERACWVAVESWHHQQRSRFVDDGSCLLELPCTDPLELVMDIRWRMPESSGVGAG